MTGDIEQKLIFGIASTDTGPLVIVGLPRGAWDYIADGKTANFDLTRAGLPVKFMLFGGPSHASVKATMVKASTLDMTGEDFSLRPSGQTEMIAKLLAELKRQNPWLTELSSSKVHLSGGVTPNSAGTTLDLAALAEALEAK